MAEDRTTRATFFMNKSARELLRSVAARYSVSQSEVMNAAPFLFVSMAEKSLKERKEQLERDRKAAEAACQSIMEISGNIVLGALYEELEDGIDLERTSIAKNQIHGPDDQDIWETLNRGYSSPESPFIKTLINALEDDGATAIAARYRTMYEASKKNADPESEAADFFDAEEEEAESELKKLLENIDINFSSNEGDIASRDSPCEVNHKHTVKNKWRLIIDEQNIECASGAELLETSMRILAEKDIGNLEKISGIKGRTRYLIARKREDLYPKRIDLSEFSREFFDGWYVGTNYSENDIKRLLRQAFHIAGYTWGIDVYIEKSGKTENVRGK